MRHSRRSGSGRALLATIALACLAGAGEASAQGIFGSGLPAPEPQQDTAAAVPVAVPMSRIPLKADEALARLQTIETQLGADADLALIEAELPEELEAVSREHDRIRRIVLGNLSLRELWNLTAIWQSHESRLGGWAGAFEDKLTEVAEVAEVGRGIRETWTLTSDVLERTEDVPDPLIEQTARVVAATDTLEAVIRSRLAYLLGVKSELDDGLAGVQQVLSQIEDARRSVRGRMLSRNDAPIWRLSELRQQASPSYSRVLAQEGDAVAAFSRRHSGAFLLSGLLFVVLALLAVRLRDRMEAKGDPEDASLKGAREALRHPLSAALLLTILASNVVWPRGPFVLWQAVALVSVVPVYRLLPHSDNRTIARTMRVLLGVFVFTAAADLFVPPSLAYRVLILIAAVITCGASGWLLHGTDGESMSRTPWGRITWRGLQVAFALSATSIVANVLGWALLGETLLVGLLYSAYLGLCILIGYRILAGMIRLAPRTGIGERSAILRDHGDIVTSRAIRFLKLVAVFVWLWVTLEAFEIIDPARQWLAGLFTGAVRVGAVEFSLEKVFSFAAVVLVTIWLARFVSFVLDVEVLPRLKLKRGLGNAISTVVQWVILGAGLLTAASALGLQSAQLAIVFGALGVGIGFGLQNVVNNFVSGLILIFEQPVKVGDKLEITALALTGEVRRIGIRSSVVRTFDGAEVIVPNSNLISSEVVNWTLSDQKRRTAVNIGVQYGTDPNLVIELLLGVARDHPEVLRYPAPNVLFVAHGSSSLDFRLQFWTANFEDFFRIRSEMTIGVNKALKEAGITIPFPQRDLWVKSLPETSPLLEAES